MPAISRGLSEATPVNMCSTRWIEPMPAISRGLSEATPPETEAVTARTPVGVPAGCCDPYRGRFRRDRSSNRGFFRFLFRNAMARG